MTVTLCLVLLMLGSTPSGVFRGPPLGLVWPSLPHLVSNPVGQCAGNLHRGFPRSPSVGCGLPYHILVSNPLGVCWQLLWGFSECPLGRVWPSLPHSRLYCLEFYWQLLRGFPSAPLGRVWPFPTTSRL